jgi:DNA-binding XRE family transcriptional regulator
MKEEEMLEDIRDYDMAKASIENNEDELIPSEIAFAILDGENPVKVWREYRELTQQQLADLVGISKPYLSQIETGKRAGTTDVLSALAKALNVSIEHLIEQQED